MSDNPFAAQSNTAPAVSPASNPMESMPELPEGFKENLDKMKETFDQLNSQYITGQSNDKTVEIVMTATYDVVEVNVSDAAMVNGLKELSFKIREALRDVIKKIQEITQKQTMELLQNMQNEQQG